MDLHAKHRTLVTIVADVIMEPEATAGVLDATLDFMEATTMGRGILLWLLGVPIPVIILLWLFFGR